MRTWLVFLLTAGAAFGLAAWPGAVELRLPLAILLAIALVTASVGGPIGRWELNRAARGDVGFGRRVLYPLCMLGVLLTCYLHWVPPKYGGGWLEFLAPPDLLPNRLAEFAEATGYALLATQALVAVLVAPLMASSAISDDRARHTLDFLLVSSLSDRQIVMGKYVARMFGAGAVLLTGLPVFALLPLLGGIDPLVVGCAFAATAIMVLSLSALGLAASARFADAGFAVATAYRMIFGYFVLAGSLSYILMSRPAIGAWPGTGPVTVADVVRVITAGDLISAVLDVRHALLSHFDLSEVLPGRTTDFLLFHLAIAFAASAYALVWLRRPVVNLPAPTAARAAEPIPGRPPIGNDPMAWKECYVDGPAAAGRSQRGVIIVSAILAYSVLAVLLFEWLRSGKAPAVPLHGWVRATAAVLSVGALVSVASSAARSVGRERDRETLDSLVASDLSCDEILQGKRQGALHGVRWLEVWLLIHWIAATLAGGLHLASLVILVVSWRVFVSFAAGLGMLFTARETRSDVAVRRTLLAGVAVALLPWLVWQAARAFIDPGSEADWFFRRQAALLTPPLFLAAMTVMPSDFHHFFAKEEHAWLQVGQALGSVIFYAVGAWWLWYRARGVFPHTLELPGTTPPRAPPDQKR